MRSPVTSRPTDPDGLFAPEVRPAIRRTIERGNVREEGDLVACEEPLEIQLGPASLAVAVRWMGSRSPSTAPLQPSDAKRIRDKADAAMKLSARMSSVSVPRPDV